MEQEHIELPKRKSFRLRDYDYSQAGYYFITICTHERKNILCNIVGAGLCARPNIELSDLGLKVENSILNIPSIFIGIYVDQYIIMPNHFHAIVVINKAGGYGNPPLQNMIGRIKSFTTYEYNKIKNAKGILLWQKSYYEHIIRDEEDLRVIREYMDNNPAEWIEDEYYIDNWCKEVAL